MTILYFILFCYCLFDMVSITTSYRRVVPQYILERKISKNNLNYHFISFFISFIFAIILNLYMGILDTKSIVFSLFFIILGFLIYSHYYDTIKLMIKKANESGKDSTYYIGITKKIDKFFKYMVEEENIYYYNKKNKQECLTILFDDINFTFTFYKNYKEIEGYIKINDVKNDENIEISMEELSIFQIFIIIDTLKYFLSYNEENSILIDNKNFINKIE